MSRRMKTRRTHKKTNKKVIIINVIVLLLILMFFSVIFSLINMGNNKIARGVRIGKIDVSNLTKEEATLKIQNWYEEIIKSNITASYEELQENISIEQFEASIDIDKLIREACAVGKSGNIIKDNYDILFTMLFQKNIDADIKMNEEQINKKIEEINSKLPDALKQSNYYIEENNLIITKGNAGIQIKEVELKKLLNDVITKEENREIIIPVKEISPEEIDIEKIHDEIYKKAENA